MKNTDYAERFEQACSARIEKLIWIAGQHETSKYKDMLEEMDIPDLVACFPDVKERNFVKYAMTRELPELLSDYNKFGFLAEIHVPKCDNFSFNEKGVYTGCSVHTGNCRISYVYAETIAGLMSATEKVAKFIFEEYISEAKKKLQNA